MSPIPKLHLDIFNIHGSQPIILELQCSNLGYTVVYLLQNSNCKKISKGPVTFVVPVLHREYTLNLICSVALAKASVTTILFL